MHFDSAESIIMRNWKRNNNINEIFEKEAPNGVVYLYFPALLESGLVKHAFSTRMGGVSKGCYSTMNLSFSKIGDARENVFENYHRIAEAINVDEKSFVLSQQAHTDNILKVEKQHIGSGIYREREYKDIDALITDERGITLVTFYADCIPVFLLDTKNKAIGLVHSGWRGTLKRIAQKTIQKMGEEYATQPEDIIACIGPGICASCYEVGEDVHEQFKKDYKYNIDDILRKSETKDRHYYLDLWQANNDILLNTGVLSENIHISNICTHCNHKLLYSHRKQGDERGNLAAFLALN